MDALWWILASGVLVSVIALVGSVTLLLDEATLDRVIMPLVDQPEQVNVGDFRLGSRLTA